MVAVSGSPLSGPNGHLRVGTAQREQALEVLRNAAADERISFDELEGRVPRALHATTRDDLAAVLADLLPTERVEEIVGGEPPLGEGPGYSWEDPLILESERWTELAVVGPWVVPPFLEVNASKGPVLLDFQRAGMLTPVIDIVVNELDALFNIDFDHRTVRRTHQRLTLLRLGTVLFGRRDPA